MDSPPPAEEQYHGAARALARQTSAAGHTQILVTGNSMSPLLRAGDAVIVRPANGTELRRGDVLIVEDANGWLTHRLIHATPAGLLLRGDALTGADRPVPAAVLVGRVCAIKRGARQIDLTARRWQLANRLAGIIGYVHWRMTANLRAGGWQRLLTGAAGRAARLKIQTLMRLTLLLG